jgi:hypothetical protein
MSKKTKKTKEQPKQEEPRQEEPKQEEPKVEAKEVLTPEPVPAPKPEPFDVQMDAFAINSSFIASVSLAIVKITNREPFRKTGRCLGI